MTTAHNEQRGVDGDVVIARYMGAESRPSWSDVTSAGVFTIEPGGRFDRHFHDCHEYWLVFQGRGVVLVGDEAFAVGPGDIVCTKTAVEHDVLAVAETFKAFWFEGATPPGGRIGHLHHSEEAAKGHGVLQVSDLADFDLASYVAPA